jgi:hypothetical protein
MSPKDGDELTSRSLRTPRAAANRRCPVRTPSRGGAGPHPARDACRRRRCRRVARRLGRGILLASRRISAASCSARRLHHGKTGTMRRQKPPVLDPEATARKVAAMALGRAAAHRDRLASQVALLERLADMRLEELSRHVNGRQWIAAVFAASGSTEPEIARLNAIARPRGRRRARRRFSPVRVRRHSRRLRDPRHNARIWGRGCRRSGLTPQSKPIPLGVVRNSEGQPLMGKSLGRLGHTARVAARERSSDERGAPSP